MRKRELFEWLAGVLKNLVVAIIRGDRGAVAFVAVAVPVIVFAIWASSRLRQWVALRRCRALPPVEEAPEERWSPPAPEEVARIVNRRPMVTSRRGGPRA